MNVKILIDSTADTRTEARRRMTVVPLTIHFGQEEYRDGVDISYRQFYEKLVESDVLPTTSQVSPYTFSEVFRKEVEAGRSVVAILISSQLSGTYQSAMIAAEEFPGRVFVVDSRNVAIGSGILAEYALRLADEGMEAADIAAKLEEEKKKIHLIALLDTLEYLKRGGRISKTAALAGTMLSIKPVICIRDGGIQILGKARGSRQGNNFLIRQIEETGVDFEKPLILGYTGLNDQTLEKYIEDSRALWEGHGDLLYRSPVGSVVGTHAGPGAIAVAFFEP